MRGGRVLQWLEGGCGGLDLIRRGGEKRWRGSGEGGEVRPRGGRPTSPGKDLWREGGEEERRGKGGVKGCCGGGLKEAAVER